MSDAEYNEKVKEIKERVELLNSKGEIWAKTVREIGKDYNLTQVQAVFNEKTPSLLMFCLFNRNRSALLCNDWFNFSITISDLWESLVDFDHGYRLKEERIAFLITQEVSKFLMNTITKIPWPRLVRVLSGQEKRDTKFASKNIEE